MIDKKLGGKELKSFLKKQNSHFSKSCHKNSIFGLLHQREKKMRVIKILYFQFHFKECGYLR